MAKVKTLKDNQGNKVYPITSANAVICDDGKGVQAKINDKPSMKAANRSITAPSTASYTKGEVDALIEEVEGKIGIGGSGGSGFTPTAAQSAALSSGITAAKVQSYDAMESQVSANSTSVSSLNSSVNSLSNSVSDLSSSVGTIDASVSTMTANVGSLSAKVSTIDGSIKNMVCMKDASVSVVDSVMAYTKGEVDVKLDALSTKVDAAKVNADYVANIGAKIDALPVGATADDAKIAKNAADISALEQKVNGETIVKSYAWVSKHNEANYTSFKNVVAGDIYVISVSSDTAIGQNTFTINIVDSSGTSLVETPAYFGNQDLSTNPSRTVKISKNGSARTLIWMPDGSDSINVNVNIIQYFGKSLHESINELNGNVSDNTEYTQNAYNIIESLNEIVCFDKLSYERGAIKDDTGTDDGWTVSLRCKEMIRVPSNKRITFVGEGKDGYTLFVKIYPYSSVSYSNESYIDGYITYTKVNGGTYTFPEESKYYKVVFVLKDSSGNFVTLSIDELYSWNVMAKYASIHDAVLPTERIGRQENINTSDNSVDIMNALASDLGYRVFENPIEGNYPDVTIYKGDDEYYYRMGSNYITSFLFSRSKNIVDWESIQSPISANAISQIQSNMSVATHFFAPCVVRIGSKYVMYSNITNSDGYFSIIALVSDYPDRGFDFVNGTFNVLVDNSIAKLNMTYEDVCVYVDNNTPYMFFGGHGNIYRVRLEPSGTSLYNTTFTKVLESDAYGKVIEGVYIYKRGDYYYLFASGGRYDDYTYNIVVGRSSSLLGTYTDKNGNAIGKYYGETVISSSKNDAYIGLGHNGDIIECSDGKTFMPFNTYVLPYNGQRGMSLVELKWGSDGFPYVDGSSFKRYGIIPANNNYSIAVFGSSNTTPEQGTWAQDLAAHYGMRLQTYGSGGATFAKISTNTITSGTTGLGRDGKCIGKTNDASTQVDYFLSNGSIPDYVMVCFGMNDAIQLRQGNYSVGDFNAVISKSISDIKNGTKTNNYSLYTLFGSMRYLIESIREKYESVKVIGVIPWQCNYGDNNCSDYFFANIKSEMTKMYNYLNVPIIDAWSEGGFYSKFETSGSIGRYTLDGIHVKNFTTVKEEGRRIQKSFIVKEFSKYIN